MFFALARGVPEAGLAFAIAMMFGVLTTLAIVAFLTVITRDWLINYMARHGASMLRLARVLDGASGALHRRRSAYPSRPHPQPRGPRAPEELLCGSPHGRAEGRLCRQALALRQARKSQALDLRPRRRLAQRAAVRPDTPPRRGEGALSATAAVVSAQPRSPPTFAISGARV